MGLDSTVCLNCTREQYSKKLHKKASSCLSADNCLCLFVALPDSISLRHNENYARGQRQTGKNSIALFWYYLEK